MSDFQDRLNAANKTLGYTENEFNRDLALQYINALTPWTGDAEDDDDQCSYNERMADWCFRDTDILSHSDLDKMIEQAAFEVK